LIAGSAAVLLSAAIFISVSGPRTEPGAAPGDALDVEGDRIVYDIGRREPGQETILATGDISNESDRTLTFEDMSFARTSGLGDVVELLEVGVVRQDAVSGGGIPVSSYITLPLVAPVGRGLPCAVATPEPFKGFELRPGEDAVVTLWLRMLNKGEWVLDGERFTYLQDGKLFREERTLEFVHKGTVSSRGSISASDYPGTDCPNEFELLPGWEKGQATGSVVADPSPGASIHLRWPSD
jgi:hypothetical protein